MNPTRQMGPQYSQNVTSTALPPAAVAEECDSFGVFAGGISVPGSAFLEEDWLVGTPVLVGGGLILHKPGIWQVSVQVGAQASAATVQLGCIVSTCSHSGNMGFHNAQPYPTNQFAINFSGAILIKVPTISTFLDVYLFTGSGAGSLSSVSVSVQGHFYCSTPESFCGG